MDPSHSVDLRLLVPATGSQFYRIGRYLLRHRKQYVEVTMSALQSWINSDAL